MLEDLRFTQNFRFRKIRLGPVGFVEWCVRCISRTCWDISRWNPVLAFYQLPKILKWSEMRFLEGVHQLKRLSSSSRIPTWSLTKPLKIYYPKRKVCSLATSRKPPLQTGRIAASRCASFLFFDVWTMNFSPFHHVNYQQMKGGGNLRQRSGAVQHDRSSYRSWKLVFRVASFEPTVRPWK